MRAGDQYTAEELALLTPAERAGLLDESVSWEDGFDLDDSLSLEQVLGELSRAFPRPPPFGPDADRASHLALCKQRALEYVDRGDLQNAFASMNSDLGKHPETAGAVRPMFLIGMLAVQEGDEHRMREWIEGFQ